MERNQNIVFLTFPFKDIGRESKSKNAYSITLQCNQNTNFYRSYFDYYPITLLGTLNIINSQMVNQGEKRDDKDSNDHAKQKQKSHNITDKHMGKHLKTLQAWYVCQPPV